MYYKSHPQLTLLEIATLIDSRIIFKNIVTKLLMALIYLYQKYLSPYKGFSCAHRLLHQRESCSSYVKKTLLEQDLTTAIKMSSRRFQECSQAYDILREQNNKHQKTNTPKRRKFIYLLLLGFLTPFLSGAGAGSLAKCCAKNSDNVDDIGKGCAKNADNANCCESVQFLPDFNNEKDKDKK